MLKSLFARGLAALVLAAGLAAPLAAPALAAKDARADRFDVAVTAQPDGSLLVTETVVFVYTGGPFTFVTRDLPTELTDGIEIVEAQMDGVTLPPGDQPGQVEISGRDPVSVRWHFAPTSDSTHTFTLTYRALGVVTTGSADVLRWQALPDEHDYDIASSTVTFSYPASAVLLGPATVEEFDGAVTAGDAQTTVTATNLGADDTLIVELRFSPGTLTTAKPAWQAAAEAHAVVTRQYAYPLAALAALLAIGGSLGGYLLWRRGQPAPLTDEGPVVSPPSPLAPALVGALASGQGEPAAPTALGTLFDLARRGVVGISQQEKPGFLGRPTQVFVVTLQNPRAELAAHEQALLTQFFGPNAAAAGATAPLTEKMQALLGMWKPFAEPVKAALRERGWWDEARQQRRGAWLVWSLMLLFLSLAVLVASALLRGMFGDFIFLLPLGLFVASLTLLILASRLTPYSDTGRAEAARWQRFSKYLTDVTANREAVVRPDLFEHYLAYAAALGLATNWLTFFRKRGEAAIPAWFQPLAADQAGSFAALIAVVSSSGASSAAGAAGAGAAGGGASGTG